MTTRQTADTTAGFTLLEALVALALMGIILGALATISAQWLPNWNRGIAHLQRQEHVALALERLTSDLAAAAFIPLSGPRDAPLFDGSERSVIFVRTTLGPNSAHGLEIIRIAEEVTEHGPILVRMRRPFRPTAQLELLTGQFSDPVVLLRPPYRVSFAYAGDGVPSDASGRSAAPSIIASDASSGVSSGALAGLTWQRSWRQQAMLPKAVMFSLQETITQRQLAVATAALIRAQLPARCITAKSMAECQRTELQRPQDAQARNAGSIQ